MISKFISDDSIYVTPEDSDDLLTLRRIIKQGDKIIGDTTRVVKLEKEYSRPDRGEKVKIRISLQVEKISLDNVLDRLRVHGTIKESNNDSVPHGSHHSFMIKSNEGFTITKKKWASIERKLLKTKNQKLGFLLVAIDTGDCGIARLTGTHIQIMPNIYSGSSGKQYKSHFKIESFFDQVSLALSSTIKENDKLIIFGPGETKKRLGNYLEKLPVGQKHTIQIVEGVDSGGEDGIYTFTKSDSMKEIMADSKLARVSSIIDEIMYLANKKKSQIYHGV